MYIRAPREVREKEKGKKPLYSPLPFFRLPALALRLRTDFARRREINYSLVAYFAD